MKNVSVIIPTFNRVSYLSDAIDSVVRQSFKPQELIIIDDGSTDETRQCVEKISKKSDLKIKYFYQNNSGVSVARNFGIREAKGELIAFLDSDDLWKMKKLELQVQEMCKNEGIKISHTKEKWLRRGEHLNQKLIHQPEGGDIFQKCLKMCAVGMSTVMVHRTLFEDIGMFDENLPCCEDYDLWLRASAIYTFTLINEPLTVKNGGRTDQLSYQYRIGMDKYRIYALERLLVDETLVNGKKNLIVKELIKKCEIYGNGSIKHNRTLEGEKYLEKAKKYKNHLTANEE